MEEQDITSSSSRRRNGAGNCTQRGTPIYSRETLQKSGVFMLLLELSNTGIAIATSHVVLQQVYTHRTSLFISARHFFFFLKTPLPFIHISPFVILSSARRLGCCHSNPSSPPSPLVNQPHLFSSCSHVLHFFHFPSLCSSKKACSKRYEQKAPSAFGCLWGR